MLPGFTWPVLDTVDKYILPSMVLISSKNQGYTGYRAISMAAVIQFIYLAIISHVDKEHDVVAPKILIGDYFYTCFFNILCRNENLEFLGLLSKAICDININITRKIIASNNKEDHTKEYLTSMAAYIGSRLAKTKLKEVEAWRQLGYYIGRLWNGQPENGKALCLLENISPGQFRETLKEVIIYFNSKLPFKKVIAF